MAVFHDGGTAKIIVNPTQDCDQIPLPVLMYPLLPEVPLVASRDSCDDDLGMVVGVLGMTLSLTLLL